MMTFSEDISIYKDFDNIPKLDNGCINNYTREIWFIKIFVSSYIRK